MSNRKTLIKAKLLLALKKQEDYARRAWDFPEDNRLNEYYRGQYSILSFFIEEIEKGKYE